MVTIIVFVGFLFVTESYCATSLQQPFMGQVAIYSGEESLLSHTLHKVNLMVFVF